MKRLAVIGAGAGGMFCAAQLGKIAGLEISVYETSDSPLKKVLLSGGGRCNFTNTATDTENPKDFYPRGARYLRKPFKRFACTQTREFFASLGVRSKVEDCGRVFPTSDDSRTIANALAKAAKGAKFRFSTRAKTLEKTEVGTWRIGIESGGKTEFAEADFVLIATGGIWDESLAKSVEKLGGKFVPPVPSLFSLKAQNAENSIAKLAGISAPDAKLSATACGETFVSRGAVLFTHFGLGGPAVLALSAFGARAFAQCGYKFDIAADWICAVSDEEFFARINRAREESPKKLARNTPLFGVAKALWEHACGRIGAAEKLWANFSKADAAALCQALKSDKIRVSGKSAHKGEFATCGGLDCECVDFKTCSLKGEDSLFFSGECLDIDAITGGFNLQAAWTTAKICADAIAEKMKIF